MKFLQYSFLWLISLLIACSPSNSAQNTENLATLPQSLAKADAASIALLLEDRVEIGLPGQAKSTYSKTQAEHVLRNFFKKYKAIDFQAITLENTPTDSRFLVGEYIHHTGRFKVYLQLEKTENSYQISAINFNVD